ncbi:MAG TPA: GntR family transcriptional regulator [Anaerolineae bacterium]|nr:GntR family transcriptional regulator [Anaerolineae bacterium]HMR63609.1 GntR family transcriptional regulator [Anaerolineae bacterium]
MDLDKQHPKPVYLQLKEVLQNQIEQGIYVSHQRLPSERDLCQIHNLSRMTARRALKELVLAGYAYTRIGKGTFVRHNFSNVTPVSKDQIKASNDEGSLLSNEFLHKLMAAFTTFDCINVNRTVSDILATYPIEVVASKLFPQFIRLTEEQWSRRKVSLLVHNYAINTLRSQLIAMMNAATTPENGPKILLACAPEDQHEMGLLSLAVSLRRRGYLVVYLGPYTIEREFLAMIETARPELICISAATDEAVEQLEALGRQYKKKVWSVIQGKKPYFTFGGVAFVQKPKFVSEIDGVFLGSTLDEALKRIQMLVPVSTSVEG